MLKLFAGMVLGICIGIAAIIQFQQWLADYQRRLAMMRWN